MSTKTRKSPVLIVALLAMIALASSACVFSHVQIHPDTSMIDIEDRLGEIDVDVQLGAGSVTVDVVIDEALLNDELSSHESDSITNYVMDEVERIELHDGFVRYLGTRDGVEGSLDLSLTAEDGALVGKIIAVDLPGVDLNSRCVARANREMDRVFTRMITGSHEDLLFQEVILEEGVLRMKVQVGFDL